jgi:DNA helicase-2/ATP-dependent DNA helicase PcrA
MATLHLNEFQKKAIEHGDGPLLIIAGAGTGKTTVITERIKYLIQKKKISPEHILALTFTEKAAAEMEDRIDRIMPYGYTQMWISTFHSFCDQVLRQDGLQIGLNPNFKLISEAESVQLFKKNLFKLKLDYYRPLGNPTKFIEALLTHFARLKDEDITPQQYIDFAKQKISHSKTPEEQEDAKRIFELASAFSLYEEIKVKEGLMDFSDLISNTLLLLRTRKKVLQNFQNQFRFVLVDEFQDTNFAQNELAILLAGNRKNITVVADDDQAIYRWRGAAISNVMQFKKNFPSAQLITLTQNYRSTQEILDRAYTMIQHNNPNRLEAIENINKKLTSTQKTKGEKIELIVVDKVDEEAEEIAKRITQFVSKGKYDYEDIAILVRANNHAHPITTTLARYKIPYQFLGPGQLFQKEEVKDLIAYLRVLYDLHDSVSLFRVLQMDLFQIPMVDLNFILNFGKRKNYSVFETLDHLDETYIKDETKEKLLNVKLMIERHLERTKKDSAGQILFYFLSDSGLYQKYISVASPAEEREAQNIAKFFDRIKTYETSNEDNSIYAVVDWIDLMTQLGDSPLASVEDWRNANAVNILTVHSSKGLEFPIVFLINLVSDRFPSRERQEKIPVPSDLVKEQLIDDGNYHIASMK